MTRRQSFSAGTQLPPVANQVVEYVPSARPGSRAPHTWLQKGGQQISMLDLYTRNLCCAPGLRTRRGVLPASGPQIFWVFLSAAYVVGPNGPLVEG
jgi:hypothetical protein